MKRLWGKTNGLERLMYPSNTSHIESSIYEKIIINRALLIFCLLFLTYIPGEVFLTMEEDDQVSSP